MKITELPKITAHLKLYHAQGHSCLNQIYGNMRTILDAISCLITQEINLVVLGIKKELLKTKP